jgi:hypothetical protein
VVSFTPRLLYPPGKNPPTYWISGWVDPEPVWTLWNRDKSYPYRDSNPGSPANIITIIIIIIVMPIRVVNHSNTVSFKHLSNYCHKGTATSYFRLTVNGTRMKLGSCSFAQVYCNFAARGCAVGSKVVTRFSREAVTRNEELLGLKQNTGVVLLPRQQQGETELLHKPSPRLNVPQCTAQFVLHYASMFSFLKCVQREYESGSKRKLNIII